MPCAGCSSGISAEIRRREHCMLTTTCYNKKASIIVDQTTQNLKKDCPE
jgi:hypothetical protein